MDRAMKAELKKLAGGERTELLEAIVDFKLPEDSAVARHDDVKLLLPTEMSLRDGAKLLIRTDEALEKGQHTVYEFECHYHDMLVALDKAIKKLFGFGMLQAIPSMFGMKPPKEATVQVGLFKASGNPETVRVPEGRIGLPGLYDENEDVGYLETAPAPDVRIGGAIRSYVRKRHMGLVDKLIDLTRHYIVTESIYQGQILDSQYQFLNLRDFDPNTLVLSEETEKALDAFLLTPIREPEKADKLGVERNRAGLLYGVYGTGKTMTMKAVAVWANDEGWTTIIARSGDSIVDLIHFGRQYQPALITVEDIDEQAGGSKGRGESLNEILNCMSGVLGEEDRVIILFTTNHPEKIHPGMLRPGRIHFAIELASLDGYGLEKLSGNMGELVFAKDIKWDELAEEFPLPPAYLKEGLNRVALFALASGDGKAPVSHDETRLALLNMTQHKKLEEAGSEGVDVPTIDLAIGEVVKVSMQAPMLDLQNKVDEVLSILE